jgi:ribosomal protein L37AE/L43A
MRDYNQATFDRCQRQYDNATPPGYDDLECPECGCLIEEHSDGSWRCTECEWEACSYDDLEEAADNELMDRQIENYNYKY